MTGSSDAIEIEPDTKDWTWVLEKPCPDCGFVAADLPGPRVGAALRTATEKWSDVLSRSGVEDRPSPAVWSPLEYMCHVRDVCRTMTERMQLMLEHDNPEFANWDQDETAVSQRYGEQDPAMVSDELTDAARLAARRFDAVTDDQWQRPGRRSDGSVFTVESLGQYFVHDVVHHLHDVAPASRSAQGSTEVSS